MEESKIQGQATGNTSAPDACEVGESKFQKGGGRVQASWHGVIIAESNDTILVEGNHYFPRNAIVTEKFVPSETKTFCGWKGEASYFSVKVGEDVNKDAAWYYADPMDAAREIKDRVAFWKGVDVKLQPG